MEESEPKPEKPVTEPAKPRKAMRRVGHGLRVLWLLALAPIVFGLIALFMLINQEFAAPTWVKARLVERAEVVLGKDRLSVDGIYVTVGDDLHPHVRMQGLVLTDAHGSQVATVDRVTGQMSPRGLLFEQRALLQDIAVSGVQLDLRRDATGKVALSFGTGQAAVAEAPGMVEVLDQIDAALANPALEALETISADGLTLNYTDERAGQTWVAQSEGLTFDLTKDVRDLTAQMVVQGDTGPNTTVNISLQSPKDDRSANLAVSVTDMPAAQIATQTPALTWLQALDAPLSLALSGPITEDGKLGIVGVELLIGKGVFLPSGEDGALPFDGAEIALNYDPETAIADVSEVKLISEQLEMRAHGQIIGQNIVAGVPQTILGQLEIAQFKGTFPELYESPIELNGAVLETRLRFDPMRFDIGQFAITDPKLPLQARGHITPTEKGLSVALDVSSPKLTRDEVLHYWPRNQFPGTRQWFGNNLLTGDLTNIGGALRIHPETAPVWVLGFDFADTTLRIVKDTPPIEQASGFASFEQNAFAVTVHDGQIAAAQGGHIDLAGSTVAIPEMDVNESPLYIDLNAQSTVTAVLSVLGQSPVRLLERINKPANMADGRADMTGRIFFPRKNPVPPSEIRYDIAANLSQVASSQIIPNRSLRSSSLALEVNNDSISIAGRARVDGVPVNGEWVNRFGVAGSTVSAQIELSPEALDAFNIGLPSGSVAGRGLGRLDVNLPDRSAPEFTLTSNLRGLRVGVPAVGWSKGPNTEGRLRVVGQLGNRPEIESFAVSGGGLQAEGSVTLNDQGGLRLARIDRLEIGNWFDAPIRLRGRGEGRAPAVEITGGTLDLRRARFGSAQGNGGPVEIALNRLQIAQGIALTNFRGSFNGAGGFNGQFSGNLNGGAGLQGTVAPQNGRSAVRIVSQDAGGIIRSSGLLNGGVGGTLDLVLLPTGGEGSFDGTLAIRNFRLRDAPAMASLLDAISVVGLLQQLDGQGLSFETVDARFRLTPTQLILRESSAVGPGLGISADGIYTLASKQLDFQGVISPFYFLNSIGSVLTRRGEGLVGFNFNVGGTAASPQVSVNPLSALTPGMFREIFRRPPPE